MLKLFRKQQNKLASNEKGGTDLLEVLMLVALFALGLTVAIGAFKDTVAAKAGDVGTQVTNGF